MDNGKTRVEAWAAGPHLRVKVIGPLTALVLLVEPARPRLSPGELNVSEPSAFLSLFHTDAVRARVGSNKNVMPDEFDAGFARTSQNLCPGPDCTGLTCVPGEFYGGFARTVQNLCSVPDRIEKNCVA